MSNESDTIQDLASNFGYVAVLSKMGEVYVFGHRLPWGAENVAPGSTASRIQLTEPAKSMSCSRDCMAIVTVSGDLYTCGSGNAPLGRDGPKNQFRQVELEKELHQAFCTEKDGLTIVYTDGTAPLPHPGSRRHRCGQPVAAHGVVLVSRAGRAARPGTG